MWCHRKGEGQVPEAVLNVHLFRHKSALAGGAKEKREKFVLFRSHGVAEQRNMTTWLQCSRMSLSHTVLYYNIQVKISTCLVS